MNKFTHEELTLEMDRFIAENDMHLAFLKFLEDQGYTQEEYEIALAEAEAETR